MADDLGPTEVVDLSNCEREPIHIPGSIQPHGLLLAVDAATLCVVQWSVNAPGVVGLAGESLPGRPIADLVDPATDEMLERLVGDGAEAVMMPLRTRFTHAKLDRMHLGVAHLYQGVLIVEYELIHSQHETLHATAAESREPITRRLKQATTRMQSCATLEELYGTIAQSVRLLSGFDRVMVYRFLKDGHGSVVGEAKASHLESFLGLHYPATDIPPQARRLYTVNTLRLIADINARAVPIAPTVCPVHGGPLDLTYSAFRSVSPIHIEYLQNMGVGASMSISLLRGGELWGLIACHHYRPLQLPFELRAGCELLGTTAGAYLATRFDADKVRERTRRTDLLRRALRLCESQETLADGIQTASRELLEIADADGMAICLGETSIACGRTPPQPVIQILQQRFAELEEAEFDTDNLVEFDPRCARHASEGSGVRMLRIGPARRDILMFFRVEYTQEVTWAGNPDKQLEATESGVRLSPRKSFAAWKQTVSGRSREWIDVDRDATSELRLSLIHVVGRRLTEIVRLNEELARINSDLNSFTYAASHDLKEPLRAVHQSLFFLEESLGGEVAEEVRHRIDMLRKNTRRMDELLEGLLRLSRTGRRDLVLEETSLEEIAREAADMSFGEQAGRSVDFILHPLPRMRVDYMCVRDLFCNLFSNALKYNTQAVRRIEVGTVATDTLPSVPAAARGKIAIWVRDNGIGIARQHHASVFEVFRRLHLPNEYGGGTGAGLAIVRKIVDRHGGSLWLDSIPGQGTTFYLCFPDSSDVHA